MTKFSFITLFVILSGCDKISAGTYPFHHYQTYVLDNMKESVLFEKLDSLKRKNPSLKVPDETFQDKYNDDRKLWKIFYFYNQKNRNVYMFNAWRITGEYPQINFIGISKLYPYHRQDINYDRKCDENEAAKREFEKEVLDKLNVKYHRQTFMEKLG